MKGIGVMETQRRRAGHFFKRYLAFLTALVSGTLLASGLAEIYFPSFLVPRIGLLLLASLVVAAFASLSLARGVAGLREKVEARTHELNQALGQQAATSEIQGVISRSPTDL